MVLYKMAKIQHKLCYLALATKSMGRLSTEFLDERGLEECVEDNLKLTDLLARYAGLSRNIKFS